MSSDNQDSESATAEARPRAIVAGHGDFAMGIVSAVDQITGRGGVFIALTNRGLGGEEITEALRNAMASAQIHLVFTDLPAGSWTLAARRLQREHGEMILVTGANLPTLLDFVFQTDATVDAAAGHAVDKGRGALAVVRNAR